VSAVDHLLGDQTLAARIAAIVARVQASPGTAKAADLIERLAGERSPVLRS
jgi:UDP:flavonoid glycosyltransferase YjiC (YdhE family)